MQKVTRAVFYIRVSHQEQVLHGLSLSAQKKHLQDYAKAHNLKVVNTYVDEGVSGRKPIRLRPALQQMLSDAQENKFDLILFIKIDRYFRSVAEYHECQKILDKHKIKWDAINEDYDITTASGRAFVNMKLTVAEMEADQTGERIRDVNDYKVKQGQMLTGSCPFGFKIEKRNGRSYLIHDAETEYIVKDMIEHYLTYNSLRGVTLYINQKYNLNLFQDSVKRLLKNPYLYGFYRGNDNFCEPYISKEIFDKIQEIRNKNIKIRKNKDLFLFSSLIRCDECNNLLSGNTHYFNNHVYHYYRCRNRINQKTCSCPNVSEIKLEKYLLENITQEFQLYYKKIELEEMKNEQKNTKTEIAKIRAEMDRLNFMFQKNRITSAVYNAEYEELESILSDLQTVKTSKKRDLEPVKKLLESDFASIYNTLSQQNKQAFWRGIIKEIRQLGEPDHYAIIFL